MLYKQNITVMKEGKIDASIWPFLCDSLVVYHEDEDDIFGAEIEGRLLFMLNSVLIIFFYTCLCSWWLRDLL